MPARPPTEHRHERLLGHTGDLADGGDPPVAELLGGDGSDPPESFDRQRVEEGQLAVGWHHQEAVGLGHAARHLGQELGAGHPDGDRQPDPLEDVAAQPHGDVAGGAREAPQPADVEEHLVDRQPFDQRGGVVEHLEHRLAGLRVGRHPGLDHDGPRAHPAGLGATHRGAHSVGLGLVAGRQHDPRTDDHRSAPQPGRIPLLDRRVERVEVGVEDGRQLVRTWHEHMFAQRRSSCVSRSPWRGERAHRPPGVGSAGTVETASPGTRTTHRR